MLKNLSIKNYALIADVNVSFSSGFTTITGETGAGKSILLGGLSLVLGKRADLSSLRDKTQKCIIEAEFKIDQYGLEPYFKEYDLDFERVTLLRREILASGKSRAFINDSPVTLDVLSGLGERLVDVHSQYQTLRMAENEFQLKVIDALANNAQCLEQYAGHLKGYNTAEKELQELLDFQLKTNKEHDYNSFLLTELQSFPLKSGIQEALEEEHAQLSNVETIMQSLAQGHQLLQDEQIGAINQLAEFKRVFQKLSGFGERYMTLGNRMEAVSIELGDIRAEVELLIERMELNPERYEEVNAQLQQLYDLQKKHGTTSVDMLIEIKNRLAHDIAAVANSESKIKEKRQQVDKHKAELEQLAIQIREKRNTVIPKLKHLLQEHLSSLGMPTATFKMELHPSSGFKPSGKDDLAFLFAANKGSDYGELRKVASGGELSRIMLAIKSILAGYEQLPTLMFDEIDTGVSGEISNKMAEMMQHMSAHMQVFSITHLPQVASKGNYQFKVFKEEKEGNTVTQMKQLNSEERLVELAEMLGGKAITDSALAHAKQLLQ
ncbi:MAG: DNA repair protein RecN [Bacteroidota bacterium]